MDRYLKYTILTDVAQNLGPEVVDIDLNMRPQPKI